MSFPPKVSDVFKHYQQEDIYLKYKCDLENLYNVHSEITTKGEFLLISIPKDKIQNIVSTGPGCKIYQVSINNELTSNVEKILNALENPHDIKNFDNLEWGLILGKFENGKYVPNPYTNDPHNGPTIYSFHMGDEQKMQEYKNLRDEIFAKIKTDIAKGEGLMSKL